MTPRIISLVLVALAYAGRIATAQPTPPPGGPGSGTIEPVPVEPTPAQAPLEEPAAEPTLAPSTPIDAPTGEVPSPTVFDPSACDVEPATAVDSGIPTTWADYEITGELVDPPAVIRALLDPTMQGSHALTASARADIRRAAASFGYHVVGMPTRVVAGRVHQIVQLAPLHLIRNVTVTIDRPISWNEFVKTFTQPLFEEEIRRRMRLRIGTYLQWAPATRRCERLAEQTRIEQYLFDEGYFDARATIEETVARAAVRLEVKVELGEPYQVDRARLKIVKAAGASPLLVSEADIRAVFAHKGTCAFASYLCYGSARFTNAQHKADLKQVAELFQKRGFPAVRVTDDFDPTTKTSFDRRTQRVSFTVTIDPRRELSVVFEGHHSGIDEAFLLHQLTFDQAGSSDEVETGESAKAITEALQLRGFFDARVTWNRERFPELDRIVFRIEQGGQRQVRAIQFVGNHAVTTDQLEAAIATKAVRLSNRVFGTTVRATSAQLAGDVDRVESLYRRLGYRDVRVRVSAATDPSALTSAALASALVAADRGAGALYARFTIVEGEPTLLTQVRVEFGVNGDAITTPDQRLLCEHALKELGDLVGAKQFAQPVTSKRCIGIAPNVKFRVDDVEGTSDRLRERLWNKGRPRTRVEVTSNQLTARRYEAVFTVSQPEQLKMGTVVIRGAFKTRESIIRGELRFIQGAPLTADMLADAARRLRSTGLFDAVKIDLPDLERTSAGEVHAVVRVEERFDYLAQFDIEGGYSSYSGAFFKLTPSFKNLFGLGMSLDLTGTVGFDVFEAVNNSNLKLRQLNAEATFRIPAFLVRRFSPIEFQTEINAFHRLQDTPRFGPLTTQGASLTLSRTWQRERTATHAARAITVGPYYNFRLRERQVDVIRPLGADDDQTQVPISTRTGSVGVIFEWEQRTDRSGQLSPLAPQTGFRFDGQFMIALPWLLSQNTFIKITAAGSKYWSVTDNLVLRADLRYDHGIPLGGAVLLPEVERFFAGGDATVRGYNDERLATEIIQVGVPPLANLQQIRILSAGGNIRALGSLDAQLRIYKVLATALFVDAGMITNRWSTVGVEDVRPSVGMALVRVVTPFGAFAFERAIPLRPQLGDDPRGRWHISFAARAQF